MERTRIVPLVAICGLLITTAGCGKHKSKSGKTYEDYPVFKEGGTMTLTMDGQPYTVKLDDIQFANTDGDYPDYVEATGAHTRIMFECKKDYDLDFDAETAYNPIMNVALPVGTLGFEDEKLTLNLPNLGEFPIKSGSLTLQKFQMGRDGHDWWDGQLTLTMETDQGPKTASGSFSWCIVPVW